MFVHITTATINAYRKKIFNSGFLNNKNISFGINTNGVAIFKSSKVCMWPVYLLVNELPLKERKARGNTLFYGIWLSKKKKHDMVILAAIVPRALCLEIKELENGVEFEDHNGDSFICRATILTCTCDLPAKALAANCGQFNGKDSCWSCHQPAQTERGGSVNACLSLPVA